MTLDSKDRQTSLSRPSAQSESNAAADRRAGDRRLQLRTRVPTGRPNRERRLLPILGACLAVLAVVMSALAASESGLDRWLAWLALANLLIVATVLAVAYRVFGRQTADGARRLVQIQSALVKGATAPLAMVDRDGYITLCNTPMMRLAGMTGVDTDQPIRIESLFLDHPQSDSLDEPVGLPVLMELVREHGTTNGLLETRPDDRGRTRMLRVFLRLLNRRAGDQDDIVFSVADVTDQVLNARRMNEFVSMVSHELRSPLASIHAALELMREEDPDSPIGDSASMLGIAADNCVRLNKLVNDLLDLDRLEGGRLELKLEDIPVTQLMELIQTASGPLVESLGAELTVEKPELDFRVRGDQDRLVQVLTNLTSNAAKFGADNDNIVLRAEVDGRYTTISVIDHGPGIPEEFRPIIFDRFTQSGQTGRRKGSGLGLTISQKLVQLMGGEIGFESESGRGTRFWVKLRNAAPAQGSSEDDGEPAADMAQLLIIGGHGRVQSAPLTHRLHRLGLTAVEAEDTTAARRLIEQGLDPQAILVGMDQPSREVLDFVQEVQETARPGLSVFLMPNRQPDSRIVEMMPRMLHWLDSPSSEKELLHVMADLFGRSRSDVDVRPRVLHVEDDRQMLELVARMLADRAELIAATTLADARKRLSKEHFDHVIVDLNLPDGDGIGLVNELADDPEAPDCTVLSAYMEDSERRSVVARCIDKREPFFDALRAAFSEEDHPPPPRREHA